MKKLLYIFLFLINTLNINLSIDISKEMVDRSIKQIRENSNLDHLSFLTEEELHTLLEEYIISSVNYGKSMEKLFSIYVKSFVENQALFNQFKKIETPTIEDLLKLDPSFKDCLKSISESLEKFFTLLNKINLTAFDEKNKDALTYQTDMLNLQSKQLIEKKDKSDDEFKQLVSIILINENHKTMISVCKKFIK